MTTSNQAKTIVELSNELMSTLTKIQLVQQARALGWKGDHARAPMLMLALFVATQLADQPDAAQAPSDYAGSNDGAHHGDTSGNSGNSGGNGAPPQGEQESEQGGNGAPPQGEQESEQGDAQEAPQEDTQQAPQAPQEADPYPVPQFAPQAPQEGEQGEQGEQEAPQEEEPQQPDEPEEADNSDEFAELLKNSGIDTPHRLLEKIWRLTAKARQNVLLVGPAGSGKTMLSKQLAQLVRLPFSSVSCTMGMSESQLTGWLLPVGEAGKFDYVESPFVRSMQSPSVFLLDELDAADPNVLMLLNSVTSNGFITIPHKLKDPTVQRHVDAVLIAGANTSGSGADDIYSARAALDAATIDRFYTVQTDYDEAYEHGLFNMTGRKSRKKSAKWEAGTVATQDTFDTLRDFFFMVRKSVEKAGIARVISTRFAQKMIAAVRAGIPVEEVKRDLFLGWSADELARINVSFEGV